MIVPGRQIGCVFCSKNVRFSNRPVWVHGCGGVSPGAPPADLAIEGPQLLAKVSHYPRHRRIDAAKKMVPRNTTFEVEEIEQLALIDILSTHHDPPPLPRTSGRRNHDSSTTTSDSFNSIYQKRR